MAANTQRKIFMDSDFESREMYLELLKRTLTRFELEEYASLEPIGLREVGWRFRLIVRVNRSLQQTGFGIGRIVDLSRPERLEGGDWPLNAESMIGMRRMNQLHEALDVIRSENIPGDLLEAGVWRGGACIFMAGFLKINDMNRKVFVADSFQGLPPPIAKQDAGDLHHTYSYLSVARETVEKNFKKYQLLDDRVVFVEGFFQDSLPKLDFGNLALLRLDADMYASTVQVLESTYSRLSPGAYVIVDDWGLAGARTAVEDFLRERGITVRPTPIDRSSVYWRV